MTGNEKVPRSPGVVPLRTILRNFLNLVETCEAGASDGSSIYETEFQELKQFSESLKGDPAYLCKEGEKTVNRKKNRYKDILPFDYTRVVLQDHGDVPGSDYINANFIKGASGSSAYIACQGPLPHTVNDFWRMVVECEVQVIVMACNEQESGKHKCENYWVDEEGEERQFGEVRVWLKKCRQVCPDWMSRTMRISYTSEKGVTERNVCQFHYSAWPDHGVPSKVGPLLDMVRLIRDCQTSETLPVLVHCSAGCGRTGTICAIDYVWGLLRLGKLTTDFSLFKLVKSMRTQRIAIVQTRDQYALVHRAVRELFEEQLKIIDSHPYANVNEYGLPVDVEGVKEEPEYETVEYNPTIGVGQIKPSTSPALPPPQGQSSSSSMLDECLENERQGTRNEVKQFKDVDDITVLSSDGDEEKQETKERKKTRPAILRKPSLIKAFFEKSKRGKLPGLSRAKSDVSTRFYSFNSIAASFQSKIHPSQKSPTGPAEAPEKSQKEMPAKPPLFAKPLLPIKRSKSLKIVKSDVVDAGPSSDIKLGEDEPKFRVFSRNKGKTLTSDVGPPGTDKAPLINSEIQTTATTFQPTVELSQNLSIPLIPPKSRVGKISSPTTGIKMGLAKEMEDIFELGRNKSKYDKLKKCDTVIIKPSSNPRTSLARSQSHVWQPTKVQLPFRIFSNENLNQRGEEPPELDPEKSNQRQRRFGSFDDTSSNSQNNTISISIESTNSGSPSAEDACKPATRLVPKTNPYSNYAPPRNVSPSVQRTEMRKDTSPCTTTNKNSSFPRDLPRLKAGFSRSRENSSESSSSTPRCSLPGTPTQTIDSTYPQAMRSNPQGSVKNVKQKGMNGRSPLSHPILTDSLSSTPSESDERLDVIRQVPSATSQTKPIPTPIPPSQKNNAIRPPVAIRERRNSFRKAVCKDNEDSSQTHGGVGMDRGMPHNSFYNHPQSHKPVERISIDVTSANIRTHRDYEPIWPGNDPSGRFAVHSDEFSSRKPHQQSSHLQFDSRNGLPPPPSSQIGERSGSEVPYYNHHHTSSSSLSTQPFQSRFDEIKLLLEELKHPNPPSNSSKVSDRISKTPETVPNISTNRTSESVATRGMSLKHQGSLRTPSRPQNPQGLSCFTFKKPSSIESLADVMQYSKADGNSLSRETTGTITSRTSDDPSLHRRQFSDNSFPQPSNLSGHGFQDIHNSNFNSSGMPVAPPRTKRLQKSITAPNAEQCKPDSTYAGDSSARMSRQNLPEVVRCATGDLGGEHSQGVHDGLPPRKHIIKALGIFQTSSNGRSKVNGTSRGNNGTVDYTDGGFASTSSNVALPQQHNSTRSTCRQQYL